MLMAVGDRPGGDDESGELMGTREIQQLLGVSRQRVQQIVSRPDFPAPKAELSIRVWDGRAVRQYLRDKRPDLDLG